MKTTKQILSLAAAAMMLSAASAQERGVIAIHNGGKAPVAVAENQQPLYVVDGRAIDAAELKNIETSKIELITIVKDESAAEYAALGDVSNGVILITLRSDDETVYNSADQMPTFLGGDMNTFRNWVMQQVRYPADAVKRGIQGDVVVKFTVSKSGLIENSNLDIISSPDPILTDEVMRVFRLSPAWEAGRSDGKKVRVSLVMPISFRIAGSDGDNNGKAGASDNRGDAAEIVVVGFRQDK